MPEPDYIIREGDYGEAITATAQNSAGAAVPIANATVTFVVKPIAGGSAIVDTTASNLDNGSSSTRGQMAYTWIDGDTDTPGWYVAAWKVEYSGGGVQTFPNDHPLLIYITAA